MNLTLFWVLDVEGISNFLGRPTGRFATALVVLFLLGLRDSNARFRIPGFFRVVTLGGSTKGFERASSAAAAAAAAARVADLVWTPGLLFTAGNRIAFSGGGFRDRESALVLNLPFLCTNSYSYSLSLVRQRIRRCSGGFTESIHFQGSWPQTSVKGRPYRYGLKWSIALMTAKVSCSVVV